MFIHKHTAEQHMLHNSIIYILKTREVKGSVKTYAHIHKATTKSKNTMNRNYYHGVEEAHGRSYMHWSVQMGNVYAGIYRSMEEAHSGYYVHWSVQIVSTVASITVWRKHTVGLMCTSWYRWGVRTLASIMWCGGSSAGSL